MTKLKHLRDCFALILMAFFFFLVGWTALRTTTFPLHIVALIGVMGSWAYGSAIVAYAVILAIKGSDD